MYAYQHYGDRHMGLIMDETYNWTQGTVASILENEVYIGNTINMRFSTKSYKDKRKVEHPREECMVLKGTHEPLVDKETWDYCPAYTPK